MDHSDGGRSEGLARVVYPQGANMVIFVIMIAVLLVRPAGDTLALSPPLIVEKHHIDQMVGMLAAALKRVA